VDWETSLACRQIAESHWHGEVWVRLFDLSTGGIQNRSAVLMFVASIALEEREPVR
jgi:hypothetical protein